MAHSSLSSCWARRIVADDDDVSVVASKTAAGLSRELSASDNCCRCCHLSAHVVDARLIDADGML